MCTPCGVTVRWAFNTFSLKMEEGTEKEREREEGQRGIMKRKRGFSLPPSVPGAAIVDFAAKRVLPKRNSAASRVLGILDLI